MAQENAFVRNNSDTPKPARRPAQPAPQTGRPKSAARAAKVRRAAAGLPTGDVRGRWFSRAQPLADGAPLATVAATSAAQDKQTRLGLTRKHFKRAFDFTGAAAGIVLLMPLFAAIAVAIKANSPGPVLFRQKRHGANGTFFEILKFRTMYADKGDQSGVRQTVANDPRVTAVGQFLRKSNFDELPQLFNVLRGEMSLVGPRPHVPGMLAAGQPYEEFDPRYMERHKVRPGLTGLAQVNGYRGETKTTRAALMRLECDLVYIELNNPKLDIKIIAKTIAREFFNGRGY